MKSIVCFSQVATADERTDRQTDRHNPSDQAKVTHKMGPWPDVAASGEERLPANANIAGIVFHLFLISLPKFPL